MAISERTVKNKRNSTGILTGKPGTVYDVNIKYHSDGKRKTYTKKGFPTKADAQQHEADMKVKLANTSYVPPTAAQRKMTVREYLEEWLDRHGPANLRPSTMASYKSQIRTHILPHIGDVPLGQLTPAMLDDMYRELSEEGLSASTVKYAHRIIGVALEHARKYHYIESNPARDILTKFGKQGKTPAPYTVEQMRQLIAHTAGTNLELVVILGGLYGLRISEILGLRWHHVDLDGKTFSVVEQLPFDTPASATTVTEMAPVKSSERVLPITELTLPYFQHCRKQQDEQRTLLAASGKIYFDNDLVISRSDGSPENKHRVSSGFSRLLARLDMPHIRFHDLRHTAATNMHELTGDFYTIGQILGHSLKGVGIQLGLSSNLEAVTAQYIDVRTNRKREVLDIYHKAVLAKEG